MQTLINLRHPNVVLFMGACRSHVQIMKTANVEIQYGIVNEFMAGGSLYDHIHAPDADWRACASPRLLYKSVRDICLGISPVRSPTRSLEQTSDASLSLSFPLFSFSPSLFLFLFLSLPLSFSPSLFQGWCICTRRA